MLIRRVFYYAQFVAVAALPLWIVTARSIAPTGLGGQDILIFLSWPVLAVALVAVLGVTLARAAVRTAKRVEWADVASFAVWYATAIAYGVFISQSNSLGAGLTGGFLALVSIAAFFVALTLLLRAARRRVQTVLAGFDQTALRVETLQGSEYRATRIDG